MRIFRDAPLRLSVLAGLLAPGAAAAQVVDRAFYNGFEQRSTHVFAGKVQESPYFGSSASYATPNGQGDAMTSPARAGLLVDRICDAGNLFARLDSTDPTYVNASVLLNVNGTDMPLACSLSSVINTCTDAFHRVGLARGDRVALKIAPLMPSRPITNSDAEIRVAIAFGWTCAEL